MNNKNILGNKIESFDCIPQNIVPFPKSNFFSNLVNKSIEIVIVPKHKDVNFNQANVGIILDEKLIFRILSKYYKKVLITKIKTKKDLAKLALRKPDLVFSGVKYFYFNRIIWLISRMWKILLTNVPYDIISTNELEMILNIFFMFRPL